MTPTALDTRGLLGYSAERGVLVCRECQCAVQNSALGSHLLRHKIYRRERQRLMSAIARLEVLEPDDVRLRPAGSVPVEGLPIISGYRCTAARCENLCASSKRMRRHWSEKHGERDPPVPFSRPALLQTFFRGTKLRYFEVRSGSYGDTPGTPPPVTEQDRIEPVASAPARRLQTFTEPRLPEHPCTVDLETLRYFHHFTNTTAPTLPNPVTCTSTHWQIDMVAQGLRSRWLMSGLLAISASHLGTLSDERATKRAHFERAAEFSQEFFTGLREVKREYCPGPVKGAKAGAQMACILRCCHWLPEASAAALESAASPFQLQLFIRTVRGCSDPDFALRSVLEGEDTPEEEESDRVTTGEGKGSNSGASAVGAAPPALLERLHSLPSRMMGPLGKPDSALDFFATLPAIDTLVECCSLNYASDDVGAIMDLDGHGVVATAGTSSLPPDVVASVSRRPSRVGSVVSIGRASRASLLVPERLGD